MDNYSIEKAKRLLIHYFDLAGCVKEFDNRSEIEDIIELIVEGVKDEIKKEIKESKESIIELIVEGVKDKFGINN